MSPVQVDTAYLLEGLQKYFRTKDLCDEAGKVMAFPLNSARAVTLLIETIAVVEKLVADASVVGAGGAKREAVIKFFDKAIKFPWLLERFDHIFIGWFVDGLVGWFNTSANRYWLGKSIPVPEIHIEDES